MKRTSITLAALVVALLPAAAGLWGNASFSQAVPVRVPASAQVATGTATLPTSSHTTEAGDDHGGDTPRDQRTEPGDDRDHSATSTSSGTSGHSGRSGHSSGSGSATSSGSSTSADDHGGDRGSTSGSSGSGSSTSGSSTSGSSGSGSGSGSDGSGSGSGRHGGSDDSGSDDHGGHGSDD